MEQGHSLRDIFRYLKRMNVSRRLNRIAALLGPSVMFKVVPSAPQRDGMHGPDGGGAKECRIPACE